MTAVTLTVAASLPRWVAWRNEQRGKKVTKVPYAPRTGRMAKANDSADWACRAEAEGWARINVNGAGGGVGLQLGPVKSEDYSLGGVDLDTCRNPVSGALESWAKEVLGRIVSYTEISPSQTGLKVYFRYSADALPRLRDVMGTNYGRQFKGGAGDHPPAIEVHLGNRFFAVTDRHVEGTPTELRVLGLEELLWLLTEAGPALKHTHGSEASRPKRPSAQKNASPGAGREAFDGFAQEAVAAATAKLTLALQRAPKLAARWNGSTQGLHDTSRSGMDMSMTALLRRAQFSFDEIRNVLVSWPHGAGAEHANDERYFRRMWERTEGPGDRPRNAASQNRRAAERQQIHGATSRGGQSLEIGSDAEIADRVAVDLQRHFGTIVFAGQYWFFGRTHWEAIPEEKLWIAASKYDGATYVTANGSTGRVRLGKARIESILACMAPNLTLRDFFASPAVGINCASGFIRFDEYGNASLEKHHPDHRCRHTLPAHWPTALTEEQRSGSLLNRLLQGCFKDESDRNQKIALLGEVAGIASLGLATKISRPKALVLKGELAENGKSQVLEVLRSLLPNSAVASISPGRFDDRTFTCHLDGKLLNSPDELATADAIASEVFKQIITGEPLTVRDVHKSAFEFRPTAQHVYATNNLPPFKGGMDRGVRRRLMVLSFSRVIPVPDRIDKIGERIGREEADLLLDWAVRGASRVLRQRGFTEPPSSVEALRDWILSSDPVLGWLDSDAVRFGTAGAKLEVRSKVAYSYFRQWAIEEGYSHDKLPAVNGFSQRVVAAATEKGVTKKRTSAGAVFVGLQCLGPSGY